MNKTLNNCPVCKSTDIHSFEEDDFLKQVTIRNDEENKYRMYYCNDCQTHFIDSLPVQEQVEQYYEGEFRDEIHGNRYYDKTHLDGVFELFMAKAHQRVNRIASDINVTDDILEIGCSLGYFLSEISGKVHRAYGTEWDSKAREYIDKELRNPSIKVMKNPEDFNLKFNKIFLFHVLEHIGEPINFLKSLKPLLKDGGKIYCEVPNVDDIMIKTFRNLPFMNFYYKKAHLYNFNSTGLGYVIKEAGYQYHISFIQRYDISNHFYWLGKGLPGGKGYYNQILSDETNQVYIKSLINAGQTDTLFGILEM